MADTLRLSQTVIDLADGDPTKKYIVFGPPLAIALATRGTARWALDPRGVARRLRPGAGHGPPVSVFVAIAARDSVTVKVGSPIESTRAMVSEASRDATRARPWRLCSVISPAMPIASDVNRRGAPCAMRC